MLGRMLNRRKAAPAEMWDKAMKALEMAGPQLQSLAMEPAGRAAVLVRKSDAAADQSADDISGILRAAFGLSFIDYETKMDEQGYVWAMVKGPGFASAVSSVQRIGARLYEKGLGDRILAAVFPFAWSGKQLYWIYQPKLGKFTPFLPVPQQQRLRDHIMEVRAEEAVRKLLPTEPDVRQWYPLWGMPPVAPAGD